VAVANNVYSLSLGLINIITMLLPLNCNTVSAQIGTALILLVSTSLAKATFVLDLP
jgi:hypothetical protein